MGVKNTLFSKKSYINCNGSLMDLKTPRLMGILNVTPDSFYDGGYYFNKDTAIRQVQQMIEEGADIIDVGGYSSRPGAENIAPGDEWERLHPVLEMIRERYPDVIISVDTFRSDIARKAVHHYRVDMINDISGGELDKEMFSTIAELNVPYVMMHMKGTPQNMKDKAQYDDLIREVSAYFAKKVDELRNLGVNDIIIDPGFGFSKNIDQNFAMLKNLKDLDIFGLPILVGLSRKSMIYKTLKIQPQEALTGTIALNTLALLHGANILRVHDVKAARETIQIMEKFKHAKWLDT
jgi:dihydropteroate synthase